MAPSGVDEQIARVQVGVEEAVAEHLVEERAAAPSRRSRAGSCPAASSASRSSTRMPPTRSVRQHAARRCARQSTRGTRKVRIAGEIVAQLRGGGGLEAQIHLDPHRSRARVATTSTGFSRRSAGCSAFGQSREPDQQVEIAGEGARRCRAAAP